MEDVSEVPICTCKNDFFYQTPNMKLNHNQKVQEKNISEKLITWDG